MSVLALMASSLNEAAAALASHALKSALAAREAVAFHSIDESSRNAAAMTLIGKSAVGAVAAATVAQRAVAAAFTAASASSMAALNVATLLLSATAAARTRTSASVVASVCSAGSSAARVATAVSRSSAFELCHFGVLVKSDFSTGMFCSWN